MRVWFATFLLAVSLASAQAGGPAPQDARGDVGRTSYRTLPFMRDVYFACWMCSAGEEPAQLFFGDNPLSPFNDPMRMHQAQVSVAQQTSHGVVPAGGAQRWEDTYLASFPPRPGESRWVTAARLRGRFPDRPEFVAWREWILARPQYRDVAFDGGTMPTSPEWRKSGAQWGYISPLTPLDRADCPPDLAACTWGDLYAYRWGRTAARSGGYGIMLSDFSDSQPAAPSSVHDFNPRIVHAFATRYDLAIPGANTAARARWIIAHAANQWNDFLSAGYGRFFAALAARIGAATDHSALVIDQCSNFPSWERVVGTDQRILARYISPRHYLCIWDDHRIQSDRGGPVAYPPMQELAGFVLAAARTPQMREGANLEADDASYWASIRQFYPGLDEVSQRKVGVRLLRRLWLWSAWAHIADRQGRIRRAIAFASRDYWDAGSLGALDPLTERIREIVPTRPFGPAFYYSVAIERRMEQRQAQRHGAGIVPDFYMPPVALQRLIDAGAPVGYYVSDAALPAIRKGSAAVPSAWIVLDPDHDLPSKERRLLKTLAPVVDSAAALASLPAQPLSFKPGGVAGFAFRDQRGRLIVTVSNPDTAPSAHAVSAFIRLAGLSDGPHTMTDLLNGAARRFVVRGGGVTIPLALRRWDTRAFAIALAPRG